ncbi:MAG: hypothetical protein PHP08_00615 [Candidatus Dojkabacteria bacterium]|nr:hypothetical protein [Candidatus Dojkabacteria bacterium]
MNLTEKLNNLDTFVLKMKEKIVKTEHKNYSMDYEHVKYHLIDEILELFELRDTQKGEKIRLILLSSEVKIDETIDIANLCQMLEMTYRNYSK